MMLWYTYAFVTEGRHGVFGCVRSYVRMRVYAFRKLYEHNISKGNFT